MLRLSRSLSLAVFLFAACSSEVASGPVASCSDGAKNGSETGVDCGGDCAPCPVASSCTDQQKGGDETDVDCGGACPPCATARGCKLPADCASKICSGGSCAAPSCSDGAKNGAESDVDCGGSCLGCLSGKACGVATDCASGLCAAAKCAPASCSDKIRNGSESDVDCGGSCAPCLDGKACAAATDCVSRTCTGLRCAVPSCTDGVKNGSESDQDCGGSCAPCVDGKGCAARVDCVSAVCGTNGLCLAVACADGVKNGLESDVDCGAGCSPCADGKGCGAKGDCLSGVCGASGKCAAPSCADAVRNGNETDVDCGGGCGACADGKGCGTSIDCLSGVCGAGSKCSAPSCADAVKNGNETDVDCGGGCGACADGKGCGTSIDCLSGVCGANGKCAVPSCSDGVKNGVETDKDCGGVSGCGPCGNGKGCASGTDCGSLVCGANKLCAAPLCTDNVKNGTETDKDCGGGACPSCAVGKLCAAGSDCATLVCTGGTCVPSTCGDGVKNGSETGVDCGGGCPTYPQAVLNDTPVGYWRLGENSGGSAFDSSGKGQTGAFSGSFSLGTAPLLLGETNLALGLANGGVKIPSSANLSFGATDSLSVEAWIRTTKSSGTSMIFSQQQCSAGALQLFLNGPGTANFRINDTTNGPDLYATSTGLYADGAVHHLVGVRDLAARRLNLFVDGALQASTVDTTAGVTNASATENWIGRRFPCANADEVVGTLDEVALYRSALSPARVLAHYRIGQCVASGSCSNTVKDGAESDVDCGGNCVPCALTRTCLVHADCSSGFCASGRCTAAPSCFEIKSANPGSGDGVYLIDPDGSAGGNAPFSAFCDMSSDGGGWTLMATLASTTSFQTPPTATWPAWTADWFALDHGDPTNPSAAFTNRDARKFRPLIAASAVLRATNPLNPARRYQFGMTPADWDLWNAQRTDPSNAVRLVGPYGTGAVKVSARLDLAGAVPALSNGHWDNATFYPGTASGAGDVDSEGLGIRYHVGSNVTGTYGFVGGVRQNSTWNLWLRNGTPTAPKSCRDLLAASPGLSDGVYPLDLDGSGPEPVSSFYCDMANGGWTMVMNQASGLFLPDLQTNANAAFFGAQDRSWRVGIPAIKAVVPAQAWKLTDATHTVFFKPTCVVDYAINYLGLPQSDCTTGYTSTAFTTLTNPAWVNCSARGIGINNSGQICSMRAYESGIGGGARAAGIAAACDYNGAPNEGVSLWFK